MNTKNRFKNLLVAAALGATMTVGFTGVSSAAPHHDNKGRHDQRRGNDWKKRPRINYTTVTGKVTSRRSDRQFQVRDGNRTYDVFSNDRLPRGLDKGDTVRVTGIRSGSDDIRNARVSITHNR